MYEPVWEDVKDRAFFLALKFEWKVASKGQTEDDLGQEAALKFIALRERYPGVDKARFATLFYRACLNRFMDLAKISARERLEITDEVPDDTLRGTDRDRTLEFDLQNEPTVVQRFVRNVLTQTDAEDLKRLRRPDGTRESREARLRRLGQLSGRTKVRKTLASYAKRYLEG